MLIRQPSVAIFLRKLLQANCREAELAYADPIAADHGQNAITRLADAYIAVDVMNLERMAEKMAHLKEEPGALFDLQEFRKEYEEAVLQLPIDDIFGPRMRKRFAPWHRLYYLRYRDMHHHLVWDIAEYEYAISLNQHGEERKASLRQQRGFMKRAPYSRLPQKRR